MLVEYFLSRIFGREFDSPHLHENTGFPPTGDHPQGDNSHHLHMLRNTK